MLTWEIPSVPHIEPPGDALQFDEQGIGATGCVTGSEAIGEQQLQPGHAAGVDRCAGAQPEGHREHDRPRFENLGPAWLNDCASCRWWWLLGLFDEALKRARECSAGASAGQLQ